MPASSSAIAPRTCGWASASRAGGCGCIRHRATTSTSPPSCRSTSTGWDQVPVTTDASAMSAFCGSAGDYGGCGLDDSGNPYVRRAVALGWELGNNDILRMQRAPGDNVTYADYPALVSTSWVRVYHPDPSSYILSPEPVAPNSALAAHLASSGKGPREFQNFVELPFRIIVTTAVPVPAPVP